MSTTPDLYKTQTSSYRFRPLSLLSVAESLQLQISKSIAVELPFYEAGVQLSVIAPTVFKAGPLDSQAGGSGRL